MISVRVYLVFPCTYVYFVKKRWPMYIILDYILGSCLNICLHRTLAWFSTTKNCLYWLLFSCVVSFYFLFPAKQFELKNVFQSLDVQIRRVEEIHLSRQRFVEWHLWFTLCLEKEFWTTVKKIVVFYFNIDQCHTKKRV